MRSGARSTPADGSFTTIIRGTGRSSSESPLPSHGSSRPRGLRLRIGPHLADAGDGAGDLDGARHLGVEIAALPGRTWMVTSRATSDCHSTAADRTSMTAPVVSEARNVMMATTATSARPAMERFGTIGVSPRGMYPAIARGVISS